MSRSQPLQGSMNQHPRPEPVPFIDIAAQRRRLGKSVDEAVGRVLAHCQFINGPEVAQLEAALAAFSGAKHVVTCASGTDALLMVLMAKGVGRGDAVLCPSFTFCATGEAVALAGAVPVFVDVDEATFNMDVNSLKRGIATARKLGLKPKAGMPVDRSGKAAVPAPQVSPPRPAFFPQNRSAASATAARSSPTTPSLPKSCAASASTARVRTSTTMSGSASPAGSIPSRPPSCSRNSGYSRTKSPPATRLPSAMRAASAMS